MKNVHRPFRCTLSLLLAALTVLGMLSLPAATVTVSAADYTGQVSIIDFPRYGDPNQDGWGHPALQFMNGWHTPESDKMSIRSMGGYNGPTCYCIEPGVGQHTGDDLTQKGEDYWEYYPNNLNNTISPAQMRRLIGRILQYGWTGNNSVNWLSTDPVGADHLAEARATQLLIHEVIVGERRADFSKIDAHDYGLNNVKEQVMPQSPIYSRVMAHYDRIEEAVQKHVLRPDFGGTDFELAFDGEKYTVTLTDRNNVLDRYNFTSDSNVTITKSGNRLTISAAQPSGEQIRITGRSTGLSTRSLLVWTDGTTSTNLNQIQDLVSYGDSVDDPQDPVNITLRVTTGNLRLVKTSEDGEVAGIPFRVEGAGVNTVVTTDSNGELQVNSLRAHEQVTVTELAPEKYVQPQSQSVTIVPGRTVSVNFSNILKKFTVTVQKQDSVTGYAQGDATLAGATYGLYKGDTLIDTYTTDENYSFTTKEYICDDDWTLRELSQPEGYLPNETVYDVGAEPRNYRFEHNPISMTVTEDVILGSIAIIKHNDDGSTQIETPEVGAEFEVYLKSAGSYAAARERERDLLVTDENGFDKTKDLPYGTYTVHQIKGNEGAEFVADFDVIINRHGEVHPYLINNDTYESYIQIVKQDAETGKTIPYAGAGYQLYDPQGNLITMTYTYPTPTEISTFYTNADGMLITPQTLPYGKGYSAVEVFAPYGYVLDSTPVYFDIVPEAMQEYEGVTVVSVIQSNMPQKGTIDITKRGEVFSSVSESNGAYQPVYALANLAGAEYRITAAEDIVTPDGTLRAAAGTVVDTVTTGNGTTKSDPLYLGTYYVQETKAPFGMVLDPTVYTVTLSYAGQNVSITRSALSMTDQRQKAVVDLLKTMEQDELFGLGSNGEIENVQFALYAAEDLTAADGSVIPKNGLLEILRLHEDGTAAFTTDLPVGANVYVQEYSTDDHYILSDTKYPVTFSYAGQDTAQVSISVNDGIAIENMLKRGDIFGKKVDDDGFAEGGALYGLFPTDTAEFIAENALMTCETNPIGVFAFLAVPYGDYLVREITPPEGLTLNETVYPVSIVENEQIVSVDMENQWITGSVQVIKSDSLDNAMRLSGFTFEVYVDVDRNGEFDADIDLFVDTLRAGENGVYSLSDLRYNGYFLHEAAQSGKEYLLDDAYYYFEIREDGETVTVSNAGNGLFLNTPVLGSLVITKSDAATGQRLADVGFRIRNEQGEIIREGYTDENGVARFDELRYGKYTYQEFSADGYVVDSTEYPFEITENEQVVSVTMENEAIPVEIPKTGGVLFGGLSVVGLSAVGCTAWIITQSRRRKSDGDEQ